MVGVDPDLIRRVGSNIMAARERAGLTIVEVAAAVELSGAFLENVEHGDQTAYDGLDLLTFLKIVRCVGSAAGHILFNG
ncbi:MAG: hypothetical protein EOP21_02025 [Hyphomicrobiales bacterium]|nr:MAG: hypothetical protein EOP21_02025 [Hyphomicrobiales bacterium]